MERGEDAEETIHSRTDHPTSTRGRSGTGEGPDNRRGLSEVGNHGAKFRDEFLNGEIFYTLQEAKVLIEGWRWEYNKVRPHSALGYRPPAPEATLPLQPASAPLHPAATAYGLTWKVDQ